MKEMYEIGVLHAFFSFEAWQITVPLWMCVVIGFAVQYLVLKKSEGYLKWIFSVAVILSMMLFEALSHIITGWDLFGIIIIYGGVFAVFVGTAAASITYLIKNR